MIFSKMEQLNLLILLAMPGLIYLCHLPGPPSPFPGSDVEVHRV